MKQRTYSAGRRRREQPGLQTIMKPEIPNQDVKEHSRFNMLLNDMYKRFGAAYKNLVVLATTPEGKELLTSQLHDLRSATRELLEQARNMKEG